MKIVYIYLRNQILYKPKGRRAGREVKDFLQQHGFSYRAVEIWMGLAEAAGLCCLIFFRDDAEYSRFQAAGLLPAAADSFRAALARTGYPADAAVLVDVSAHSDETVQHSGGYYRYFK